ncbi:MAG TPA: histidine kinase N-terminal 7TM domain-containing protein, partial [Spirochaetia bacterium]|nr:histidine kinase N-terminal 7TM domain-containing protein [Spirochaetia bacterium]
MVLVIGILAATALLSGQLAAYMGIRSRGSQSAALMAITMAATAWWSAGNALEDLLPGLMGKLVMANLQYAAITTIPVLWCLLCWSLDREERSGSAVKVPLVVWIVPLLTFILVWTDPALGLVRRSFRLESSAGFTAIAKEYGPWFWVHAAYSYVMIVSGTVLMIRGLPSGQGVRRSQRALLIIGSLLPAAANVLYVTDVIPSAGIDPTPLAFSVTGLLLVANLGRFRFLSLVTAAQSIAIEQLHDAVLILDHGGRLAYANAAARGSFGVRSRDVGRFLADLGPTHAGLSRAGAAPALTGEQATVQVRDRRYEARTGDISRGRRSIGSVVTYFDVTDREAAAEQLRSSNLLLEQRVAERTRALQESNAKLTEELESRRRAEKQLAHDVLHDTLTGLPNRSLLSSRIEQLIVRARRDPS